VRIERTQQKGLMAEVAHVGEDHRNAVFVGRCNHFIITN
jgi:hypothetical protein